GANWTGLARHRRFRPNGPQWLPSGGGRHEQSLWRSHRGGTAGGRLYLSWAPADRRIRRGGVPPRGGWRASTLACFRRACRWYASVYADGSGGKIWLHTLCRADRCARGSWEPIHKRHRRTWRTEGEGAAGWRRVGTRGAGGRFTRTG